MKKKLTGFALLSSLFLLTACNATNTGGSGSGDGTKSEQVAILQNRVSYDGALCFSLGSLSPYCFERRYIQLFQATSQLRKLIPTNDFETQ